VQAGDTTTFDLAEVSREYQAELSRSHDVTGPTDSVTTQASVDAVRDSSVEH
jgi:hypothetical protein